MNSHPPPVCRILTATLCFCILHFSFSISRAAEPDLRTLLRDALFEEEATRDLDKAAAGYEALLTKWSEQRNITAAALYRLAEVRRKQDRKADAIILYQRLVAEFPDQDPHARLSRENLAALGAKEPAPSAPATPAASDEEAAALARVQKLAVESPDLLAAGELEDAARQGWLSVVKFLVSKNVSDKGEALWAASRDGHLAVVRELLTLKPLPAHLASAVDAAVQFNRLAVLKLLLENGASPDGPADSERPPLCVALEQKRQDTVELLLARKANVNPPKAHQSPLYFAAFHADVVNVQRLLALGADIEHGVSKVSVESASGNREGGGEPVDYPDAEAEKSTPLHAAVWSGSQECVSLLLKAGANSNALNANDWSPLHGAAKRGDAAIIARLLAAGAKADGDTKAAQTPLLLAVMSRNPEAINELLKGKADPNLLSRSAIAPAASAACIREETTRDEILTLLLEHGADPAAGKFSAIHYAPVPLKVKLLRGYQYPKFAAKLAITLVYGDGAVESPLAVPRAADEKPAPLATALLAWHDRGGWNIANENPPPDWSAVRLYRKGEDGNMTATLLPIKSGAEFPSLQWGDVIEVLSSTWDAPPSESSTTWTNGTVGLPPDILAILRGTQTVRVTFKSGDFTRDLTLRGILRVYDPTTTEAPLISTWKLVALIAGDNPGKVKVERSAARGGGAIEWGMRAESGLALPEEGDIITFTPDPKPDHERVALRISGHPGRWTHTGDDQQPTLFQFLADFYGPLPLSQVLSPDANHPGTSRAAALKALTADDLLTNLIQNGAPVSTRPYLPWPDWSSVKIRRMFRDGEQKFERQDGKVVDVGIKTSRLGEPETINLLAAMAALPADALPEDARKLDILLNPGDEVELPLLKDHTDAPWPGFDEATARAFRKALVANVTLADDTGRFRRVTLQWMPPRWVPTPAGVLPIPDGDASDGRVHWLRARDLADSAAPGYKVAKVTRGDQKFEERGPHFVSPGEYFLRPGDTLLLTPAASNHGIRPGTNNSAPQIVPPAPQPAVPGPQ